MEAIGNPFTPVPKNRKSHVRGWTLHWMDLLDDPVIMEKGMDFGVPSTLYFEHGVNISPGQLNLFGGLNDEIASNIMDIILNEGIQICSLDFEMAEMKYPENLRKRLKQKTCSEWMNEEMVDELENIFKGAESLKQIDMFKGSVCVGDSHATSYARSGQVVERVNGLTLYSALRDKKFRELLAPYELLSPEVVTLVAGSIDIRHHLMRQDDPHAATRELVDALVQEAQWISGEFLCEVELSVPVPVEFEGRRIPKTGYYKDEPFFGSQRERQELVDVFYEHLNEEWQGAIVHPPAAWYSMNQEDYAKEYMELSSSVHISPHVYRKFSEDWNGA